MPRTSKSSEYISNGVAVSPSVPSAGENCKIVYDGLLSKSGATHLFAHIGFGNDWNNSADYEMKKITTGFEVSVPITNADTLNICFKDCADNWDNNSGKNYSFDIAQ
ncbi:MAG: carbohydrate-binding protein [Clostridia bacterium]|nr:carbohydrate-binding protein [Clostridia bacterium]